MYARVVMEMYVVYQGVAMETCVFHASYISRFQGCAFEMFTFVEDQMAMIVATLAITMGVQVIMLILDFHRTRIMSMFR